SSFTHRRRLGTTVAPACVIAPGRRLGLSASVTMWRGWSTEQRNGSRDERTALQSHACAGWPRNLATDAPACQRGWTCRLLGAIASTFGERLRWQADGLFPMPQPLGRGPDHFHCGCETTGLAAHLAGSVRRGLLVRTHWSGTCDHSTD